MGANLSIFSCFFPPPSPPARPSLGDLPEDCAAPILSYLDPPEICMLAELNRAFRGASWADFVWKLKLPENHEDVLKHVVDEVPMNLCMRDVYTCLCKRNTFDGGTKKAWLDKRTGGVCLSIAAKGLAITGIDDRRYWNYFPTEESRFRTVAYLQQTWWFEVVGELEFPFPAGTYSVYTRLQLGKSSKRFGRRICNTEHVHGWDIKPVRFELSTSDGQHAASKCFLDVPGKWVQYFVGDFFIGNPRKSTKIKFSVTQIDCTHTKGGLSVDSVQIYPKKLIQRGGVKAF